MFSAVYYFTLNYTRPGVSIDNLFACTGYFPSKCLITFLKDSSKTLHLTDTVIISYLYPISHVVDVYIKFDG